MDTNPESRTHLSKALAAAEGKSTSNLKGLLGQAAKNVISDRQVLARIVKESVAEAAPFSIPELEQLIPGEVQVSVVPVDRDDAEAAGSQDPSRVRQDNMVDGTVNEGTVYFDILFTLQLPGEQEPILLIINVEIQNKGSLPYPLERRGMIYTARLVGRQETDYANIKKVYSIWIVCTPQSQKAENTIVRLVTAKQNEDGSFEAAPKAAQVAETWFLNLGDPDDEELASQLLEMLDVVFAKAISTEDKASRLRDAHGMRMTAEMRAELEDIKNVEWAIEQRAFERGLALGREERDKSAAHGAIEALLDLRSDAAIIVRQLAKRFNGDQEKAVQFLRDYLAEHPQEGAYLEGTLPWQTA